MCILKYISGIWHKQMDLYRWYNENEFELRPCHKSFQKVNLVFLVD